MSRLLYFDCFSGISGDMALGALLDAGLPFDYLKEALGSLAVSGYSIRADRVLRCGISATKFSVVEDAEQAAPSTEHVAPGTRHPTPGTQHHQDHHHHPHRHLSEINTLIDQSALSHDGRGRAKAMFLRLAEAEASIHQVPLDKVHLHEVGALDSIIDIVGVVAALDWFAADRIVCSPLNVGGGMVESAHGVFPVPAPATVKLLGDAPIYTGTVHKELVTPTGALIATTFAAAFGAMPPLSVERVGYGAGDRDDPVTPNVLRVWVGRPTDRRHAERALVIECEIDDMNPQLFGVAMDRLYAAGALEVFYTPVQMKKNRPGTLLTVIASPDRQEVIAEVIFRETTTIGLRYSEVTRECLERRMVSVETPIGAVRFKVASRDGRVINAVPEFDDCASLATAHNLSVKEVQVLALQAYASKK